MTGKFFRKERNRLGISQLEISHRCNLSRYKIYLFEAGYGTLAPKELEKVVKYFKEKNDENSKGSVC